MNSDGEKGIIALVSVIVVIAIMFPIVREFLIVTTVSVILFILIGLLVAKCKKGSDK